MTKVIGWEWSRSHLKKYENHNLADVMHVAIL